MGGEFARRGIPRTAAGSWPCPPLLPHARASPRPLPWWPPSRTTSDQLKPSLPAHFLPVRPSPDLAARRFITRCAAPLHPSACYRPFPLPPSSSPAPPSLPRWSAQGSAEDGGKPALLHLLPANPPPSAPRHHNPVLSAKRHSPYSLSPLGNPGRSILRHPRPGSALACGLERRDVWCAAALEMGLGMNS